MREINKIILHCSATKEGELFTVEDIDRWHKARGFKCIGYHYVIYQNGRIKNGRPVNEIGAHCKGYNKNSIGICYIGGLDKNGKPKDTRTPEQKESLRLLLEILKRDFPDATIHAHYEFANKRCPCFDPVEEYGRNGERILK